MRVVQIPRDHPYVSAIGGSTAWVDDPWDVDELRTAGVDVVHLHFGYEHLTVDDLERWVDGLDVCGISLVVTVHDIDNPHLIDQSGHHARTGLLVRRATAVSTLTGEAAHEIRREWGRVVDVIPHPSIAPLDPTRPVPERDGVVVWLSTLRPSLDLDAVAAVCDGSDHPLDLVVRADAWDRSSDEVRDRLRSMTSGTTSLDVTARLDDAALFDRLRGARVLVLPYRWGTHSGMVELAVDAGTPVLTTPSGCRAEQGAIVAPPERLSEALERVLADPPSVERDPGSDRESVIGAHRRLYAQALATKDWPVAEPGPIDRVSSGWSRAMRDDEAFS